MTDLIFGCWTDCGITKKRNTVLDVGLAWCEECDFRVYFKGYLLLLGFVWCDECHLGTIYSLDVKNVTTNLREDCMKNHKEVIHERFPTLI